jgi:hypothetical protein
VTPAGRGGGRAVAELNDDEEAGDIGVGDERADDERASDDRASNERVSDVGTGKAEAGVNSSNLDTEGPSVTGAAWPRLPAQEARALAGLLPCAIGHGHL